MKALIILSIFATLAMIYFQYSRNKNLKKLFIALVTFAIIISLAVVGSLNRHVMPLFIAHVILLITAWSGLIIYMIKDRYYGWIIFSPVVAIVLFLLLEAVAGSGNEGILPHS